MDVDDVNGKYFENSPWLCSWLILQRYKNYAYKSFINEAVFFKDIKG
nr:hypothetical protein [Serratia sp. DD3]